jgi:hypothetical protein
MPPEPAPAPSRRAVSPLDHRLEAATGHDIDTLWAYRDRGVLDEQHAQLVDRHRKLAKTQTGVIFHLRPLNRLSNGEFEVDGALFTRIDRTVDQLEEAADARDTAARDVLAALEPIEVAAAPVAPVTAASGTRIPHTKLRRLEDAGLVAQDTGHPVHAGQPVALTDAGRAALFAARRAPTTQTPKVPACPGTSLSTPAQRR